MNIYFTSDWHLSHANIIEYTNRPFKTSEEMNSIIIKNCNERVKKGDLVFFIGDFCFKSANNRGNGGKENPEFFINQLNTTNTVFISGNHDCFSEDTLLLTIRGYKKYEELKIGDLIPTLNLISRKLEIQPIEDIIVNPVNEIYGFKNRSSEGKFSSNHKLLFAPYNHNRFDQTPLTKNTVKELWKRKSHINLISATKSNNEDWNISKQELELLGWIYTDGSIDKYGKITIYQSKEKNILIIKKLLLDLGLSFKDITRHKKTKEICGKIIKNQLIAHEFPISLTDSREMITKLKLKNKYDIPDWLWNLSDAQMQVLIEAMILGNGAINGVGNRVIWGQKFFLEKIMGLCVTHGIDCNLILAKNRGYYLCLHTKSKHYIRQICSKYRYIENKQTITWCVTVKNHTLFTALNGKPLISGNSRNSLKTPIQSLVIYYGGKQVRLVHNPAHIDYNYSYHFTGHVHQHWKFKRFIDNGRVVDCCNVGVDQWNFYPITINEIESEYQKWLKSNNLCKI